MMLLGLEFQKADAILRTANKQYKVVDYHSFRPYADADSRRVVRANEMEDGSYELIVCEFKTKVPSQG